MINLEKYSKISANNTYIKKYGRLVFVLKNKGKMKMNIEKVNPNIKYIYHYTLKKNVKKILAEQEIISKDQYVFFTKSLKDYIIAFEREMMQENKLYIDVNGN